MGGSKNAVATRIDGVCWLLGGSVTLISFVVAYLAADVAPWIILILGLVLTLACAAMAAKAVRGKAEDLVAAVGTSDSSQLDNLAGQTGKDPLAQLVAQAAQAVLDGRRTVSSLSSAIASSGMPLFISGLDNNLICASRALLELAEVKGDVAGSGLSSILGKKVAGMAQMVLSSGSSVSDEMEMALGSGQHRDMHVYMDEVRDGSGAVTGVIGAMFDMTDVKRLMAELQKQQEKLMATGSGISELSQRVASASEELSASADEQARGAEQQKTQSETVATAMEEMTATVLEVAQNASATSEAAGSAQESARDGVDLVTKTVAGINSVSESTKQLAMDLAKLDEQSGEIGRIINVINDIADQTNLLALNAAIEAARAGEAGRGFAVVADEVRKLAEKTMVATKDVEHAIRTIQNDSKEVMRSMKSTEMKVEESNELTSQTGDSLRQIMANIEDMAARVAQIATAAEEQSAAAEEINQNVEDIAVIAREADEGASQTAEATRELAELSQSLLSYAVDLSGATSGTTVFWESEGQMRGVLPKMMMDFLAHQYPPEVARAVSQELGNPVFLPTVNYPDQVVKQLATIAGEAAGSSAREVLFTFGKYTIPQFRKMYRRYFKADGLREFLLGIDDVHSQLTRDYPGIKPPKFTYDRKGDVLIMEYNSGRGLFDYFDGILHGAADYFNERIETNVRVLDDRRAQASIRIF